MRRVILNWPTVPVNNPARTVRKAMTPFLEVPGRVRLCQRRQGNTTRSKTHWRNIGAHHSLGGLWQSLLHHGQWLVLAAQQLA